MIMAGLRHSRAVIEQLKKGVRQMKESVTYQMIIEEGMEKGMEKGKAIGKAEGKAEGIRDALLLVGGERLGPGSPAIVSRLDQIVHAQILRLLLARVGKAASWDELLAES